LAPCGALALLPSPCGRGVGGEGSLLPEVFAPGAPSSSFPFPAGEGGLFSPAPASSASRVRMTVPSDTSSPSATFTSLTLPAAVEGTSMVALSDSSVIRPCSLATLSPAATITSITGTLSMPTSGTLISIVFAMPASLHQQPAQVAQHLGEIGGKTRRGGTVDDAVVVGQRQRQHQTRLECAAVPDRCHAAARDAKDGHLRCIDDGRELGA